MSDTEGSLIPFEEGGCTLLECDDFDNDDIDFEDDCIGGLMIVVYVMVIVLHVNQNIFQIYLIQQD